MKRREKKLFQESLQTVIGCSAENIFSNKTLDVYLSPCWHLEIDNSVHRLTSSDFV